MLSHVSSGASYMEYFLLIVSKRLQRTRTSNVKDLRVVENPEKSREIFALDILERVRVLVGGTEFLVAVVARADDLLTEKQRFPLKKVAVNAV